MEKPVLYVVVPCYNEEAVLPETAARLTALLAELSGRIAPESRVLFVDDGSRDGTWSQIETAARGGGQVAGLKLAHNAGHQNALWAGMEYAREKCDALISIDADLQDDVNAIPRFLDAFADGCDVVYGVRSSRETDTRFKRATAQGFYRFMDKLGVKMVYNHADYRLLSRRALDALMRFPETNLFLRGMVPMLGFKSAEVAYARGERFAGESKYPLGKMLSFAMEGVTSFSVKPVHFVLLLGALCALLGVAMAGYALISLIAGHAVPGWTSIMISVWILGGLQLLALGLIGEYVGKVYTETKRRPRYLLEKTTEDDEHERV